LLGFLEYPADVHFGRLLVFVLPIMKIWLYQYSHSYETCWFCYG
jgi:hypothetical protein